VVGHERVRDGFSGEIDESDDCCDACSIMRQPKRVSASVNPSGAYAR
jgi:hypothetical protein